MMGALEKESTMTAAEVAEYLGIGKSTVYQLPIPYYSYGSRRVYDLQDVQEYKSKCRCVNIRMGAPSLNLTASLTVNESALQSYYQKRGLLNNAKPTTKKKQRGSTRLQLVKK